MSEQKGMPGMRGLEHIGLTVPNLEEAERFFCDVLGAELAFDAGEVTDPDIMTRVLRARNGDSCRYRFYRLKTGTNLELFEYKTDDRAPMPENRHPGGHHLAFYVDDIHAAARHLAAHGVEMAGPPEYIGEGPGAGTDWLYFRAPWGLQMELVSYPKGKGYEASSPVLLWSPVNPER